MHLSEKTIRGYLRETLLLEFGKIVVKTSDIRILTQYDPILRKMSKSIRKSFKNDDSKEVAKSRALKILDKAMFKDKNGTKEKIHNSDIDQIKRYDKIYQEFISEYYDALEDDIKNPYSTSIEYAKENISDKEEERNLETGPKKGGLAMTAKTDEKGRRLKKGEKGAGYKRVRTGLDKSVDVPSIGVKGIKVKNKDGSTYNLEGEVALNNIFANLYANKRVLKLGSGGKKDSKKALDKSDFIQVKTLQGLLKMAGYGDGLSQGGYFDESTKAAVERFQEDLGLKVDGIVGRQTASALNPKVKGKIVPITGSKDPVPAKVAQILGLTKVKKK
jgi:hypothetical protein